MTADGLAAAWAFAPGDSVLIRGILERGAGGTSCADLERAIAMGDEARRKAGHR